MGCFDFTYADNGKNICGSHGYLHLTQKMKARLGCKDAYLRFDGTDEYGDLYIKGRDIDVYALYACMLALEGEPDVEGIDPRDVDAFLDMLGDMRPDMDAIALENLMDRLREPAISYFFRHEDTRRQKNVLLPKMGNQPTKAVVTKGAFDGNVPLLITRKKMPEAFGKDAVEIARTLSVTSGADPNQGFSPTKGHWIAYKPEKEGKNHA